MILCAGEALIDMLPRDLTDGTSAFAPHAGGSIFNTSIGLGRLGVPVQLFTGLSSDLFGDVLRDTLAASNVDGSPAHVSDRPTTLAFVTLTDGHASYAFYDENTAGRMITADDLPQVDADLIMFGGISLAVEPCAQAYHSLMQRETGKRLTMIDPNIRPSFIPDEARYRARLMDMLQTADIIKTSDEDLEWITGGSDGAALLADARARVILLTKGADGVSVITRDGTVEVPAQKATVVDTVGAGDTFTSGFLAGLHDAGVLGLDDFAAASNDTFVQATKLGTQVAAITVARAGANPPWRSEL